MLLLRIIKEKAQAYRSVFVCEWFGMGGGNSLHASIFFVNGGVRVVGAVKATSMQHSRRGMTSTWKLYSKELLPYTVCNSRTGSGVKCSVIQVKCKSVKMSKWSCSCHRLRNHCRGSTLSILAVSNLPHQHHP